MPGAPSSFLLLVGLQRAAWSIRERVGVERKGAGAIGRYDRGFWPYY